MSELEILEPVCEIVLDSRDIVAEAIASGDAGAIAEACLACVENVRMAAELGELAELQEIASAITEYLGDGFRDGGQEPGLAVLQWVDDVLLYLAEPGDTGLLKKLSGLLPLDRREKLLGVTVVDAANPEIVHPDAQMETQVEEAAENAVPRQEIESDLVLKEVIANAREEIFDEVDKLSNARIYHRSYPEALANWIAQVDHIGAMADAAGKETLGALCALVSDHYATLAGDPPNFTEDDGYHLIEWTENISAYMDRPGDSAQVEKILSLLPVEMREGLAEMLLFSGATALDPVEETEDCVSVPETAEQTGETFEAFSSASPDFPDEACADSAFPEEEDPEPNMDHYQWPSAADVSIEEIGDQTIVEDATDEFPQSAWDDEEVTAGFPQEEEAMPQAEGMLGILQEELAEVAQDLTALAGVMTEAGASGEAVMDATAHYGEIVERVVLASDSLGMTGLRDVCDFINQNASLIATGDSDTRCGAQQVLAEWPVVVMSYLSAPADEALCLSVIDHLQKAQWPEPLNEAGARALLGELASEITMPALGDEEVEVRETVATPEDVALEIPADVNQELVDAFFQESPAHAATLSDCVSKIAANVEIPENVAAAQRIAHTLKGSANLVGAKGVANLTHHMEDIFEFISAGQVQIPQSLSYTLQEAADCVETMLDALQGRDERPDEAQRILQEVLDWANRIDSGNLDEPPEASRKPVSVQAEEVPQPVAASADDTESSTAGRAVSEEVLRVPTRTVDDMFRMVGEMSISVGQMREHLKRVSRRAEDLRMQDNVLQQRRFELEDAVDVRNISLSQRRMSNVVGADSAYDSLEMDQYDELYGSAHSFIETVVDYREMMLGLQDGLSDLDSLFHRQQRLNKELQQAVMSTRMVPVNTISSRLQRAVRQACRATAKQVELEIVGADLMMDGDVLNNLTDPIMHMLRNSVDHGIEPPEEREAAGKPATGRVVLEFSQDGSNMLVRCEDDGRGLDYSGIRETAVRREIISEGDALDEHAMGRLILKPGFSTREKATQISGRGVGMDVVNTTIRALSGNMDIGNRASGGCRVSLRLPITLVTSHAVLVRVDQELFAVPTNSLSQILASGTGEFRMLGDEMTYQLGKDIHTTRSLASLVGVSSPRSLEIDNSKTVLLVRSDDELVAVAVDYVVGSFDLVIKSTGAYVQSVPGVAGVSILGDGGVVSVLNVPELMQASSGGTVSSAARNSANVIPMVAQDVPRVLIVDDSLSVRKSLSQLVSDSGYEISVARDGLEAVEVLRKQGADLVLTDLEMPRMTGLELTSHIRANEDFRDVPVIMITSRSLQKHREHATRVGVNEYMNKPFSEDELLGAIESLLEAG